MVGSRTVLQVKSYARHYCKNKLQSEETGKEDIIHYRNAHPLVKATRESTWASTKVLGPADPNLNAVKIETLSDDEEVDITDEADDLLPGTPSHTDLLSSPNISPKVITPREYVPGLVEQDNRTMASQDCLPLPELSVMSAFEIPKNRFCTEDMNSINNEDSVAHTIHPLQGVSSPSSQTSDLLLRQEGTDLFGDDLLLLPSCQLEEDEEEEELKPPDQEVEIDREAIMEEEKQAIPEFFEGRPSKTPDRYLKIRNFILAQWEKCKPKYLNKTSVRPGLKNCGDVNCIGRVHTYLELIGAINFGCEQCVYNRPKPADRAKSKEAEDGMEAYQLAQRLQSMRTRRRRVRDSWGNWRDAKELEGQTFEHLSAEELANRYDEEKRKSAKSSKVPRQVKRISVKCSSNPDEDTHNLSSRNYLPTGKLFRKEQRFVKAPIVDNNFFWNEL